MNGHREGVGEGEGVGARGECTCVCEDAVLLPRSQHSLADCTVFHDKHSSCAVNGHVYSMNRRDFRRLALFEHEEMVSPRSALLDA